MKRKDFCYHIDDTGLILTFDAPRQVVSTAPYHGGFIEAKHIYNYKVDSTAFSGKESYSIEETFAHLSLAKGLEGPLVGLMTAAKIPSFVTETWDSQDFCADIFISAGLSNAMRAGDDIGKSYDIGTINTILILHQRFSAHGLIEAIAMLTEAKAAVLQDLGVLSYTSGRQATGTGTDAVLVANGQGIDTPFCGKHTAVGRDLARLFFKAFQASVLQGQLL